MYIELINLFNILKCVCTIFIIYHVDDTFKLYELNYSRNKHNMTQISESTSPPNSRTTNTRNFCGAVRFNDF